MCAQWYDPYVYRGLRFREALSSACRACKTVARGHLASRTFVLKARRVEGTKSNLTSSRARRVAAALATSDRRSVGRSRSRGKEEGELQVGDKCRGQTRG